MRKIPLQQLLIIHPKIYALEKSSLSRVTLRGAARILQPIKGGRAKKE